MWFQYWDVSLRWQQASFLENDNFAHNFEQQQFFCVTHYPLKTNKNNQTKKQNENQLYHVF